MTIAPSNPAASAGNATPPADTSADERQIVLEDIGARWYKFSEYDLSALTGRDDLVSQLMAKYRLDKVQAQRDTDALLKGRRI